MEMNRKDRISAIAILAVAALALFKALQLPIGTIRSPETAFMPVLLCGLLIILASVLLVRSFLTKETFVVAQQFAPHWKRTFPIVVMALFAYCFLLNPLGYIVTTLPVLFLVALLAGCSWKESSLISVGCVFPSYYLIVTYLKGPMPQGILPF